METKEHLSIGKDFSPPTWEQWMAVVQDSLKGADFEKVMKTRTYEDIILQPIYRKEDITDLPFVDSMPGEAPYQRGNSPESFIANGWVIAQAQSNPDLQAMNLELLSELNRGLSAVNLVLAHDDNPGAIAIRDLNDLKTALQGVDLQSVPIFIQMDTSDIDIFELLATYLEEQGKSIREIQGGIGYDPTGEFARKGYLSLPLDAVWTKICDCVHQRADRAPKLRCLCIDGTVYESAGASGVQELAFVLSTAIGYIQGLLQQGMTIDTIAPLFQVKLSLGSNFFMEIAKIRAFRLLWSEMIRAFGGNAESQKIWIHGKTARFNKSISDIYVNMLRTSTEGFAGVIGGVDSMEIDGFDSLSSAAAEFSKRIARNQQLVLAEEAHFSKVVDPAGGCYYIESLTAQLADKAWKLMQELENTGGMVRNLKAGTIHKMLGNMAKTRIDAVHKRKDVFVGVNMYANPTDQILVLERQGKAKIDAAVSLDAGALSPKRAVEELEELRRSISNHAPQVFLLNMGSISEYKARADFATGFFQVGGFDVICPAGFESIAGAVDAAKESGASAFCICSTDDKYTELVKPLCSALEGKTMILAGYPADMVDIYKQNGIDIFIHLRANLMETLSELAEKMEVKK